MHTPTGLSWTPNSGMTGEWLVYRSITPFQSTCKDPSRVSPASPLVMPWQGPIWCRGRHRPPGPDQTPGSPSRGLPPLVPSISLSHTAWRPVPPSEPTKGALFPSPPSAVPLPTGEASAGPGDMSTQTLHLFRATWKFPAKQPHLLPGPLWPSPRSLLCRCAHLWAQGFQ